MEEGEIILTLMKLKVVGSEISSGQLLKECRIGYAIS